MPVPRSYNLKDHNDVHVRGQCLCPDLHAEDSQPFVEGMFLMSDKKVLAKFYEDWGRHGSIESVFVTTIDKINEMTGKNFYFGECLGKHSEVTGKFKASNFTVLSADEDFVTKCEEVFKNHLPFGNVSVEDGYQSALEHDAERAE